MKEIGGYFGLEQLISNEYYKDLIPLNNGRNALLYLLKARNIKKLYIPYYLVNVVSEMCSRNGYSFKYYNNHNTLLNQLINNKNQIDFVFNLCDEGYNNEPAKELHLDISTATGTVFLNKLVMKLLGEDTSL